MITNLRVGIGYDIHKIVSNRPLILGGVEIASDFGLDGHSDADVIIHAIMDALLGAIGFNDIGVVFPNTDNKFKNIKSTKLLEMIKKFLDEHKWKVINIDVTLIAEKPKIAPYVIDMKKNISQILEINLETVNIKATTNESLGALGRLEGMAAYAVALVYKS